MSAAKERTQDALERTGEAIVATKDKVADSVSAPREDDASAPATASAPAGPPPSSPAPSTAPAPQTGSAPQAAAGSSVRKAS